jgi:hypothetical protein
VQADMKSKYEQKAIVDKQRYEKEMTSYKNKKATY